MIGALPRPKRNPNAGRKPKANRFLMALRLLRRKRVAYARAQACDTARHLQRQLARVDKLAAYYRVPVEAMPVLPTIPAMPNQDWIEYRRDMGELKPPVIVTRPEPQAGMQTA